MRTSDLYRRFRRVADRHPDDPAFTFLAADFTPALVTFAELFEQVEAIAASLERSHPGRRAPLGILLGSQRDQTLHYLAALHVGAVPAILTPPNRKLNRGYYLRNLSAILKRSRFEAVITDLYGLDIVAPVLSPYSCEPQRPGVGLGQVGAPEATPPEPADGLDAAFMQFSSGTTGMKRGVLVRDDAVLAQLEAYAKAIEFSRDDRILSWLPLYHDMGFIACLNLPLAYGVHTVVLDPIDWVGRPSSFLRAASEYRTTLSWNPNFAYSFMAQRVREAEVADIDLSSVRSLVNCSEPVTHDSQQQFLTRFAPYDLRPAVFKGCYAMAETTFALTHGEPTDPSFLDPLGPVDGTSLRGPVQVSVGRPLPGVELRVVEPEEGTDVPDRHVGEIHVRSPFNFDGYFGDPEATREAFHDGWYRTGDLGYRIDNDAYFIVGRRKDVIIVGGVNVFPQDIEDLVSAVQGIRPGRVSTFSVFDPRLQTESIVVLAERDGSEVADVEALPIEVRQQIVAAFQVANLKVELVPAGWLIKSTSGKMARSANRQKWLDERSRS